MTNIFLIRLGVDTGQSSLQALSPNSTNFIVLLSCVCVSLIYAFVHEATLNRDMQVTSKKIYMNKLINVKFIDTNLTIYFKQ